jgi:hypothetical protein
MKKGHPRRTHLSLYAGGDLGAWDRLRVGLHVRNCARCNQNVDAFRLDRETLRTDAAALPSGVDWDRLSGEMTANIRVGLAAGQCVDQRKPARALLGSLGFKPAAALASVTALLVGGWWLSLPGPGGGMANAERFRQVFGNFDRGTPAPAPYDNVITLASTQDGLEVKQNGALMRIVHPGASPSVVTASTAGSVRARYIDDDTGQVTITNVYSQ